LQVCDYRMDCTDQSDESDCQTKDGDCRFDGQVWGGGCQYVQNKDDNADWGLSDGSG